MQVERNHKTLRTVTTGYIL